MKKGNLYFYPYFDIVEIGGKLYVLNDNGWNGERWHDCWEVLNRNGSERAADEREYSIKPIYRFQAEKIDLESLEENGEEWNSAVEVVDYEIQ